MRGGRLSRERRTRLLHAIVPTYLIACIVLGGASAAGALANTALQLLAIPILWFAVTTASPPLSGFARQLSLFPVVILLLFVSQLVPLPPEMWAGLPGRASIAEGYRLMGIDLPWMPVSLMPQRTLAALLWLLPPCAVLYGMIRLGAFNPKLISWCLGIAACASVLLGAVQIGSGNRAAYIYERSSFGTASGFFANVNHFGTLMLMTLPLLAATISIILSSRGNRKQSSAALVLAVAIIFMLLVGIILTRSLAAAGLLLPVALASFLIIRGQRQRISRWLLPIIGVVVVGAITISAISPSDNDLTTAAARTEQLSRYGKYVTTLRAARDYLPLGTGFGTMPTVFHLYEDPTEVGRIYASHTHSDPLELVLDGGVPAVLLLLIFLAFWVARAIVILRSPQPDDFARAAIIASAAALAHSLVDYPLRTAADAAVFAAMLALMAGAQPRSIASRKQADGTVRHLTA